MKELFAKTYVRRLLITLGVVATVELMTGPPGSNTAPTAGFRGSFAESASFFGLFKTQRWVLFLFIALVAWGIASFWINKGPMVRATVSRSLVTPRHITAKRSVRWGACLLYTSPSPRDRQKSRMPSS